MTAIYTQRRSPAMRYRGDGVGYIIPSGALYLGPEMNAGVHTIHNYLIYIATHGCFDLFLARGEVVRACEAAVVAPDCPHRIVSSGARLGIFYLVPETIEGRRAAAFFSGQKVFSPPASVVSAILPRLRIYAEHGCNPGEAQDVSAYMFSHLTPTSDGARVLDERIVHIINFLDSAQGHHVTVGEVASEVAISYSRLEHLFSEQVGIPIRSYLLWARVRRALQLMVNGDSLTGVALDAGFSDSPHLSRTFRRMIGISPSTLLRKADLYEVQPE